MNPRMNLGDLITLLSTQAKSDSALRFDFGGTAPTGVSSYRGYYEDLAIEFSDECEAWPTVGSFLKVLKNAVGQTFQGYKGGDYKMHKSSRLWVANYGNVSDTAIVGLCDCDYKTVLQTRWEE